MRNTRAVVPPQLDTTAGPTTRARISDGAALREPTRLVLETGRAIAVAPPRPARRRPGLIPTDLADALSAVLGRSVEAIRTHEAGSRAGGDIENVHQMRVATRRIRAYLKAAKPALDPEAADGLRRDLAELAQVLGMVRDLDVMIDRLHAEAAALGQPDTAALERLIASLDAERQGSRGLLIAQLDDPGHASLLSELDAAAARPPVANPWADLTELGAAEYLRLSKARNRLARRFGDNPPDDDLHALRILGKRARYTAELQPRSKAMTRFLQALAQFQETLGDHQDATVLEDRLRHLVAASGHGAAAVAAGRVIEGARRRKIAARANFPGTWSAVAGAAEAAYPTLLGG
jgi:CHAD domain-containing protein